MLIASMLFYQISSVRYTTRKQIFLRKIIPMWYNTKMEYQKVKCKLNKREQNVNVSIMKKVIPRSVKLIWSAEKYNEQTPVKIGQS